MNKLIFIFLTISCCTDVILAKEPKVKNFANFFDLKYSDMHVEELLKLKVKNIEEEILKKFLKFVDYQDDTEEFKKYKRQFKRGYLKEELSVQAEKYLLMDSRSCLSEIVESNLQKILKTKSGKYLILRLTYLLNRKKEICISFERVKVGSGITQSGTTISIDLEHLFTSTDFYVFNNAAYGAIREEEIRPDVYIFHELLHFYHWLYDKDVFEALSKGEKLASLIHVDDLINKDLTEYNNDLLKKCFPNVNNVLLDYEEMRTIIGVPYKSDEFIICENSYRLERKIPIRINLLDASIKQDIPKSHNMILNIINKIIQRYVR